MLAMPMLTVPAERVLFHDVRAVHDIAAFRFAEFEAKGKKCWLVLALKPAPQAGAQLSGARVDEKSRELTIPNDAGIAIVKAGEWKRIAAASLTLQPERGAYHWTEPLQVTRGVDPEYIYSPFVDGGTLLCCYHEKGDGIARFQPRRLLFDGWGDAASQAFGIADRVLGSSPSTVEQQLSNDNALIRIIAFRNLLQSQKAVQKAALTYFSRSTHYERAITVYNVLVAAQPPHRAMLVAEATAAINRAVRLDELEPIMLGAFVAGTFQVGGEDMLSDTRRVLRAVKRRLADLHVTPPSSSALSLMLEKADVD